MRINTAEEAIVCFKMERVELGERLTRAHDILIAMTLGAVVTKVTMPEGVYICLCAPNHDSEQVAGKPFNDFVFALGVPIDQVKPNEGWMLVGSTYCELCDEPTMTDAHVLAMLSPRYATGKYDCDQMFGFLRENTWTLSVRPYSLRAYDKGREDEEGTCDIHVRADCSRPLHDMLARACIEYHNSRLVPSVHPAPRGVAATPGTVLDMPVVDGRTPRIVPEYMTLDVPGLSGTREGQQSPPQEPHVEDGMEAS